MSLMAELGEVQPQEAPAAPREPVQPAARPYSIFDNPRHQQAPRQICAPPPSQPPMVQNSVPPPWHAPPAPPMPMPPAHPMGQYPPPPMPMPWSANPPLPGTINPMHPPGLGPAIPPPPGTDLAPPGTFGSFDDGGFGKKQPNWNVPPPIPSNNFWNPGSVPVQPPLPSFLVPPPPPPAD